MTREEIQNRILQLASDAQFPENKQYPEAIISADKIHEVARNLKDTDDTAFDYLFCLSGVDYPDYITLVYHLTSTKHGHSLVLKVNTANRENPETPTLCDIWPTAEFHEREVYDLLGVRFTNHPDLRRIFLDDNWVGYPLRKDYKDEINIIER